MLDDATAGIQMVIKYLKALNSLFELSLLGKQVRVFKSDGTTMQQIDAGFKFCLVSPELQGGSKDKIIHLKSLIQDFSIHAVCTKFPEIWE